MEKAYSKNKFVILFLILSLHLVSCSHTDSGVASDTLEKDTVRTLSAEELINPIYPSPYFLTIGRTLQIIEFGEVFELTNMYDYDSSATNRFVGIGINYIKDYSKRNGEVERDKELKFELLDEALRKKISEEYDDFILVSYHLIDQIPIKSQALIGVDITYLRLNNIDTVCCRCVSGANYLKIFPIVDNKITIPEFWEEPYEYYSVPQPLVGFDETNKNLQKLGLDDNLFRDGMTIEDFEDYLNLASNPETFAPLFKD